MYWMHFQNIYTFIYQKHCFIPFCGLFLKSLKGFIVSLRLRFFLIGILKCWSIIMTCQTPVFYPSIKELVSLSHLKTHNTPHTPENCKIELKEISDFMVIFVANVIDSVELLIGKENTTIVSLGSLLFLLLLFQILCHQVSYHFGYCLEVVWDGLNWDQKAGL